MLLSSLSGGETSKEKHKHEKRKRHSKESDDEVSKDKKARMSKSSVSKVSGKILPRDTPPSISKALTPAQKKVIIMHYILNFEL